MPGCLILLVALVAGLTPGHVARSGNRPPRLVWRLDVPGRSVPVVDASHVYVLTRAREVLKADRATGGHHLAGVHRGTWSARTRPRADPVNTRPAAASPRKAPIRSPLDANRQRIFPLTFSNATTSSSPATSRGPTSSTRDPPVGSPVAGPGVTAFPPVVAGELVVAGFSSPAAGGLVAVDATTGDERWRVQLPVSGPAGGPLVAGAVVVVADRQGTVHAFDSADGTHRWSIPARVPEAIARSGAPYQDFRALAWSGRTLIAGSLAGEVIAYDLASQREVWRQAPVPASAGFSLAVSRELVYVPYLSGHMVALSLTDGREVWRLGGRREGFSRAPRVVGNALFVAGTTTGVHAYTAAGAGVSAR